MVKASLPRATCRVARYWGKLCLQNTLRWQDIGGKIERKKVCQELYQVVWPVKKLWRRIALVYFIISNFVHYIIAGVTELFVICFKGMCWIVINERGHLKYTAKTKYRNFEANIPRKGISGSQSQFPHSWVCERIIQFPQTAVCLFCRRKYVDRSWDYINRSQTHECWNWGWGRAISRKGIHNWEFLCSVGGWGRMEIQVGESLKGPSVYIGVEWRGRDWNYE